MVMIMLPLSLFSVLVFSPSYSHSFILIFFSGADVGFGCSLVWHVAEAVTGIWTFIICSWKVACATWTAIGPFTGETWCSWTIPVVPGGGLCCCGVASITGWPSQRWVWGSNRPRLHSSCCRSSCDWWVRNGIAISPSWWSRVRIRRGDYRPRRSAGVDAPCRWLVHHFGWSHKNPLVEAQMRQKK